MIPLEVSNYLTLKYVFLSAKLSVVFVESCGIFVALTLVGIQNEEKFCASMVASAIPSTP